MDTKLPKPLSMQNTSRLPAPTSRLKAPTSYTASKAAPPIKKRSRSPEEAPSAKRARVAPKENQRTSGPATSGSRSLSRSSSASSLNSTTGSQAATRRGTAATQPLKRNVSGGRITKATAPVKPSSRNTTKPENYPAFQGSMMSRIPVFIERGSRKGWNKTGEACIFIACDSACNSVDVEEHTGDSADFVEQLDETIHDFTSKESGLMIDNVSLAETNIDTSTDCFDEETETVDYRYKAPNLIAKLDDGNAESNQQETKVCKNEIKACKNDMADRRVDACVAVVSCCQGVVTAGCNCVLCSTAGDSRAHVEGSGAPLVPPQASPNHSLLPRPVRLQPGNIELTPAPAKRSRKPGKRKKTLTGIDNRQNTTADFDITDNKTTPLNNGNEKTSHESSPNIMLLKNAHGNFVKKSTGSVVYKSVADCEDSEPESMQHENKQGNKSVTDTNSSRFGFKPRTTYSNSKTMPQKQAVLTIVHKEASEPRQAPCNMMDLANTQVEKMKQNVSSSLSRSSTSSTIIRQSPDTFCNSLSSTSSASLQERRHIYTRSGVNLSTHSKSVLSSIPTIKKHLTPNSVYPENSVPTKSTNFKAYHKAYAGREEADFKVAGTSGLSKSKPPAPVISNKASKQSENLTTSSSQSSSRRNLPSAPAERRTVKYGQRCVSQKVPSNDNSYKAARPTNTSSQKNDRPPSGAAAAAAAAAKQKRPAWDIKGRLQDMEEHMKAKNKEQTDILQQMVLCNERIATLESTNNQLSGTVAQKDEIVTNASKENEALRKQIRETEDELCTLKRQFERDTENFEFTKASLRRQKEALEGEISALQQEVSGLKSSVAQLTSSQAGLQSELEATKLSLETSTKYGRDRDAEIVGLKNVIAEKIEVIEDANRQMREHETVRRKLHNTIQELKGNIRVFCRVRPLLGDEALGLEEIPHMNFPEDDNKTLELEKLGDMSMSESTISGTKRTGSGRYAFSFDRTFNPDSTQCEVFEEISQLVQSALDGYNVCIFAYGQTGSGKTYTMEGPTDADDQTRGMIPRAVMQIFTCVRELEDKGWQYGFEASFLEIYNETIRDLLGNHGNDVKHEIKLGASGGDVTVTHLTTVAVSAEQQIIDLLKTASKNRAVGETQCNERSSRSHSVFRLKISGCNELTGESCKGTLNLVDLAGSERLKDSGATGQRLKETQAINKSLSNLGNVIMALGNKEAHIPYRNSKLTYLLQNSLGGNSKTLMFVNVSPREDNFSETLNSLRFATKVNQCNIGTATKKVR